MCANMFFLIKNRTGELRTGNINSDLYKIYLLYKTIIFFNLISLIDLICLFCLGK